jgi:hypothetical protein
VTDHFDKNITFPPRVATNEKEESNSNNKNNNGMDDQVLT